ncbi:MAG TPA: glycosyltransferase family 4 protein [Candidatus Paceibacterota bacterium]
MEDKINHPASLEKSPKKRVLFVVTQSEMGGAQRFFYTLIPRLNKDKYEVMVAAGPQNKIRNQKFKNEEYSLLEALKKESVTTFQLKHLTREVSLWKDIKAVFEIRKLIKSWHPDVLFLNSSKAGFLGSFTSKFLVPNPKLSVLYRIGGWTFNDPWPRWKKGLWILLEKISANWKDLIIVNNLHDMEQANKLGIRPKEKIALVYNGIDAYKTNFLSPTEAKLKLFEKIAKYSGKIFQTKNVIGTIANFYPAKGLENLIKAAREFKDDKDTVFILVGDGVQRENLEWQIKNYGLENKVFLIGYLPKAFQYLTAFDIFVLPSVKEGFPWSILEAMNAKLPIIATRVGAVSEIIEDNKNGMLVEPAKPEQIAAKLRKLINDNRLRQEFGIQAHQTVLFKFPLEKVVKEIEALL